MYQKRQRLTLKYYVDIACAKLQIAFVTPVIIWWDKPCQLNYR